jgi:hypothetical protein
MSISTGLYPKLDLLTAKKLHYITSVNAVYSKSRCLFSDPYKNTQRKASTVSNFLMLNLVVRKETARL